VLWTLAGAAVAGIAVWNFRPSSPLTIARFSLALAEGQQFGFIFGQMVAISADGTQIVYQTDQGLYLRSMSDFQGRPILEGAITNLNPVFSPDGRSIAFYSIQDGTLKRIAVSGGAVVTLCQAEPPFGMSWGTDGILFGQGNKGIMRVSPDGGKPELLVSVKGDEFVHGPQMLPGGQAVLFTLAAGTSADLWDRAQVVVQVLKSGDRKTLIEGGSDARYVPTGHLVYALGGVLFAAPFDPQRLQITTGPVSIVEGVRRAIAGGVATAAAHFSFSGDPRPQFTSNRSRPRAPSIRSRRTTSAIIRSGRQTEGSSSTFPGRIDWSS
jgi:serine/threonine-protein kinase